MGDGGNKFLQSFKSFTQFVKDISWWLALGSVALTSGLVAKLSASDFKGNLPWIVILALGSLLAIVGFGWSAYVYRKRWSNLVHATK